MYINSMYEPNFKDETKQMMYNYLTMSYFNYLLDLRNIFVSVMSSKGPFLIIIIDLEDKEPNHIAKDLHNLFNTNEEYVIQPIVGYEVRLEDYRLINGELERITIRSSDELLDHLLSHTHSSSKEELYSKEVIYKEIVEAYALFDNDTIPSLDALATLFRLLGRIDRKLL